MNAKNPLALCLFLSLVLFVSTSLASATLTSSALSPAQLLAQAKQLSAVNYRLEILGLKQQLIGVIEQQRRECQHAPLPAEQKACWSQLQLFERQVRTLLLRARNQYIRQIQADFERRLVQSEKDIQQHPNRDERALAPVPTTVKKK